MRSLRDSSAFLGATAHRCGLLIIHKPDFLRKSGMHILCEVNNRLYKD